MWSVQATCVPLLKGLPVGSRLIEMANDPKYQERAAGLGGLGSEAEATTEAELAQKSATDWFRAVVNSAQWAVEADCPEADCPGEGMRRWVRRDAREARGECVRGGGEGECRWVEGLWVHAVGGGGGGWGGGSMQVDGELALLRGTAALVVMVGRGGGGIKVGGVEQR